MSTMTLQQARKTSRHKAALAQDSRRAKQSLAVLLTEFRQHLEAELAQDGIQGIGECDLNAAALLDDLCEFIGLGPQQRARVLGASGAAMLEEAWQISPGAKVRAGVRALAR